MTPKIEEYTRVSEILAIFQAYAHVDRAKLKKAQDIGTNIHSAIESYFKDEFIPLDSRKAPYFESFLRWADSFHPIPIASETRLYDHILRITGQFDLLATLDGVPFLIDFKTGSWAHPEIWEMQMTFYRYLMGVNGMPKPDKFMIVQLQKDGSAPKIFDFTFNLSCQNACMCSLECFLWFRDRVVLN